MINTLPFQYPLDDISQNWDYVGKQVETLSFETAKNVLMRYGYCDALQINADWS